MLHIDNRTTGSRARYTPSECIVLEVYIHAAVVAEIRSLELIIEVPLQA
jgi:hypothetical protein